MPIEYIALFIAAVLSSCTVAILLSVSLSFLQDSRQGVKREQKSIVATATMLLFFLCYYLVIRWQIGRLPFTHWPVWLTIFYEIVWLSVIVFGTVVNVLARRQLGENWADQIKIYTTHQLQTSGWFSLVRHPLYASLIWIFIAGSLLFFNWLALILTVCVFIPAMSYRAKQEEKLLLSSFPKYSQYQNAVSMFWPKIKLPLVGKGRNEV